MDQFSCPTVPLKRQRENSVRSVSDLCPIKGSYRVPIRGCLVRSKNFIGYASRGSRVVEAIKEFYRGRVKTSYVRTTGSTAKAAIIENFYGGFSAVVFSYGRGTGGAVSCCAVLVALRAGLLRAGCAVLCAVRGLCSPVWCGWWSRSRWCVQ